MALIWFLSLVRKIKTAETETLGYETETFKNFPRRDSRCVSRRRDRDHIPGLSNSNKSNKCKNDNDCQLILFHLIWGILPIVM